MSARLLARVGFLATLCSLVALASSVSSAQACDAGSQHAFGIVPGCFDQRIAGAPEASNLAPDFTEAGGHPFEITVRTNVNSPAEDDPIYGEHWPPEALKDIFVKMPQGLVANSTALPPCTLAQLSEGDLETAPMCPPASQVGVVSADLTLFEGDVVSVSDIPLYFLGSSPGSTARIGFKLLGITTIGDTEVGADRGVSIKIRDLNAGFAFDGASVTLWGSPADPDHTPKRACPGQPSQPFNEEGPTCGAGIPPRAFLRLPTSCAGPAVTSVQVDSWQHPGDFKGTSVVNHLAPGLFGDPTEVADYPTEYPGLSPAQWGPAQSFTGCDQLPFDPSLKVEPITKRAASPTGLEIELAFPQAGLGNPDATSEADMRRASIALPRGLSVNPSVANGLTACTAAEVGLASTAPATCPASSKLGRVQIESPLIEGPILGSINIAAGAPGPPELELPVYLVAENENVAVKLSARVVVDETTGQLTAVVDDSPQIPIERLAMQFFDGQRAPFVSPSTCGAYTSRGEFTPWSKPEPVPASDTFEIAAGPSGGQCPPAPPLPPFGPSFSAGVTSPVAGASSSFTMRIGRREDEQEISAIEVTMPPGLSASLRGTGVCPDAALVSAAATGRSGVAEVDSPSCPRGSELGRAVAVVGAGSEPFRLDTGRIYLAGPYEGASYSLAVVLPAVAGPIDMGSSVLRLPLRVDRKDGHLNIAGKLPTVQRGIALMMRSLSLTIDRPGFLSNPTNCDPMAVDARIQGNGGGAAIVSSPFQMLDCGALGFEPRASTSFIGGRKATRYAAHPGVLVKVRARRGDAAVRSAVVTLPATEQLDPSNVRGVCTRRQFDADRCPRDSVYGFAEVVTPLLDEERLSGPVYLRSSENKFPDLAAKLAGQVSLDLSGRIGFAHGRVRVVFPAIPDVPVSRIRLTMSGGKRGILVNNRNLCRVPAFSEARLVGQNGKRASLRVRAIAACGRQHRRDSGPAVPRPSGLAIRGIG